MRNNLHVGMKDSSASFTMHIDERTGFLKVEAVIARTGIQKYLPIELGDDGEEPIGVLRSKEEVAHPDSVASFVNIPITDDHPTEMVDIENHAKYAKGSISSVDVVQLANGITALKTQIVITDKTLIESIKSGKKELSVGYENILVQKEGTYDGESYKYIQTDIRANHVAVVDAGRCGGVCKLMIDDSRSDNFTKDEGETVMKITINGEEFDVDEKVGAEIEKLKEAAKAKSEDMEEEKEKNKETVDKLQGTIDSLTTSKAKLQTQLDGSSNVVDTAVTAKLAILMTAKDAGVEVKTTDTVLSIKQAIVKSLDVDTTDKSETYLDAVIDMRDKDIKNAAAKKQKAIDSINKVGDEYTPDKTIDVKTIGEKEIGA